MNKILDFLIKKINNFYILPKDNSTEICIDMPITKFENLDPDDDLNTDARDLLITEIEKIMKRKVDIRNTLEFKQSYITCRLISNNKVVLDTIRSNEHRHMEPVFFTGKKSYPLRIWLEEQILSNDDVVELEKGLIKMI